MFIVRQKNLQKDCHTDPSKGRRMAKPQQEAQIHLTSLPSKVMLSPFLRAVIMGRMAGVPLETRP